MITRFDKDMDGSMEPEENGRWVRYDDHKQALDEKDREIEQLKDQYAWKISPAMVEAKIDELHQAYHALMGKAIEFAQYLDTAFWPGNNAVEKAQEFLASPKVQAWREQEEQP